MLEDKDYDKKYKQLLLLRCNSHDPDLLKSYKLVNGVTHKPAN